MRKTLDTTNKECRSVFFNDNNTLINKREKDFFYEELEKLTLGGIANLQNVFDFLSLYKKKFSKKCRKLERLNAIMNAVDRAINEKISVYEGMVKNRDFARRQGRKVIGRYVGTTLLTKGLEFDVVFVLNPAEYSRNDLYVALTRASKDLLVISTKKKIIPKPEQ